MYTKEPLISIIIPVYNAQKTIKRCLEHIYSSKYTNYEVIVADDCSTDDSFHIVRQFPCRIIKLKKKMGPAAARNRGAEIAKGEILLFIDSDVLIIEENLELFVDSFKFFPEAAVIQSVYSSNCEFTNFASRFKTFYYDYSFNSIQGEFIPTVASFCFAIKKEVFDNVGGFNENITRASTEDDELGHRLTNMGYKILLNRQIKSHHVTHFSLYRIFKRDFEFSVAIVKCLLRNKNNEIKQSLKTKKFASNVGPRMILGPQVAALAFLSLIFFFFQRDYFSGISFLFLNVLFFYLNLGFLNYVSAHAGVLFALKSYVVTFFDMLFVELAIIAGIVDFCVRRKKY